MTENRIALALTRLFEKHRIIFWYDSKKELRADFDVLEMKGIEKLEIDNNELALKYQILREQPKQQFLLYKEGPEPEYLQNWLLDVQLAQGEFRTDQVSIWLSELELGFEFTQVVEAHSEFFASPKVAAEKRKQKLKDLLKADDTASAIRLKMIAVCVGCDARVDHILEYLLSELSQGRDTKFKLLQRSQLDKVLWQVVQRHYGYVAESPTLKDFAIALFEHGYEVGIKGSEAPTLLTVDALVFLRRWKDSRKHQEAFEALSEQCAGILAIESDLNQRDMRQLIELDYFELIDKKIIHSLVNEVEARTVSAGDVSLWVRQRRQSHWYDTYQHLYNAIDVASQFIVQLDTLQLDMSSDTEAVEGYTRHWYRLDQLYRQYIYALRVSGHTSLLNSLTEQVENFYTNRYLLPLNNHWQKHVDAMQKWQVSNVYPQQGFYNRWVAPFVNDNKKIYVIISDAFRYESGNEMLARIRQEDRYQANLDFTLSVLPSYTQLGMAALLPHKQGTLRIKEDKSATTEIETQSTQGTANRDKILKAELDDCASAMKTDTLMEMTNAESRELLKANDVIYFYHNRIDHTGDKMQSEGEAFEAVERTFNDLMKVIKKLAGANASNILITADHGFIYQNKALSESDFLNDEVHGDILYRDRRFILGKGLQPNNNFKHFTSEQLGLTGDVEVSIPKGINRLRLKGSGSRFVHGGASLQEVIVPVLKIKKIRQSDITAVEVDILRSGSSVITSGQLGVTLYQTVPASDKVQARTVRAGIYTEDNQLISDQHMLTFDLTSDNPRERELKVRFVLTQEADAANGQEVLLKLEELESGTSYFKEYKSQRYKIRRSFTSDFDF